MTIITSTATRPECRPVSRIRTGTSMCPCDIGTLIFLIFIIDTITVTRAGRENCRSRNG
jgi:hypothetical protein